MPCHDPLAQGSRHSHRARSRIVRYGCATLSLRLWLPSLQPACPVSGTYPAARRASPRRSGCSVAPSPRRRRWSPSPPGSGAGGAAAAASRGTPELPRAPSARLVEAVCAPRRRLSGRGTRARRPRRAPLRPQTSAGSSCVIRPMRPPTAGGKDTSSPTSSFFLELGSDSRCIDSSMTSCTKRPQRDQDLISF